MTSPSYLDDGRVVITQQPQGDRFDGSQVRPSRPRPSLRHLSSPRWTGLTVAVGEDHGQPVDLQLGDCSRRGAYPVVVHALSQASSISDESALSSEEHRPEM